MHAARAAVARGELRGREGQLELQEQHAHLRSELGAQHVALLLAHVVVAALAEDVDLVGLAGGHVVVHELDGHRGGVALIEHEAAQVEQSSAPYHLEQTLRDRVVADPPDERGRYAQARDRRRLIGALAAARAEKEAGGREAAQRVDRFGDLRLHVEVARAEDQAVRRV